MPLTNYECPVCGTPLHTDDLMEGECLRERCRAQLPEDFTW